DRKANMIISGGVNVYPQESENRLITHPGVVDAAVFGIPHPDFGEEVKAVVQLADGKNPSQNMESELIAYCKEVLSPIKCPRSIDFRAELPRKENGKLYKRLLKDEYLQN
ncbi:MAG: acyl-CoA synthetase, partial [Pseudomonadota bacterium]